jgi:hypothetical protein
MLSIRLNRFVRSAGYLLLPLVSFYWPLCSSRAGRDLLDALFLPLLISLLLALAALPGYATLVVRGSSPVGMSRPLRLWFRASTAGEAIAAALLLMWIFLARERLGAAMADPGDLAVWSVFPALTIVLTLWIGRALDGGFDIHPAR